ncbi:MAG TPA: tail fiber protein [Allosphingosinicella sp.]|jgi:microcystin-dependent protein
MSDAFLSEIRMFAFGHAPKGWALCNGQLLPINQNQALFSLLGTTYGGNGQTNFALPDLRGRLPLHEGSGHILGEKAGSEAVTLSVAQMPAHIHQVNASTAVADNGVMTSNYLGGFNNGYRAATALVALQPSSVTNAGGSQPHQNMSPFIVINYCIALIGIFPSPN